MSSENCVTVTLTDSLPELSVEVQKNDESETKTNLSDLQTQLRKATEDLKQNQSDLDKLQSKIRSLELDLAKKNEELSVTKKQLENQTNQVRYEINNRMSLENSNRLFVSEYELLKRKLNDTKEQLRLATEGMQAEKEKRIHKCNEWNTKYQILENECSTFENELMSYKKLETLAERINRTRKRIVNGTKDRVSLYEEVQKMSSAYKRKSEKLENRNMVIPDMNFPVLLDEYHDLYEENTGKFQDRLERVDEIKEESKTLTTTQYADVLEEVEKAVHKHLSLLGQLQQATVNDLTDEEELGEQIKDAYQVAKEFFKSAFNK